MLREEREKEPSMKGTGSDKDLETQKDRENKVGEDKGEERREMGGQPRSGPFGSFVGN